MAEPLFINELIHQILNGNIRIPSFQRGFIWDADRVAHLMDSVYKGFPFGSLLFWRTRHPLKTERNLGPFELPVRDPDYSPFAVQKVQKLNFWGGELWGA